VRAVLSVHPLAELAAGAGGRPYEVVLKVVARRCKILGFDKPDEKDPPAPRTVVVGGTSEEYVATLQALIAEAEP
jgi:hypothetical protein